jgi:2-polyprenyl-3-methyl-5-hydroxy-6-metoxy-1,4-benzoquinol methylase
MPSEVKEYYDEFADRVLLSDFRYLNLRQEAIKELCTRYVPRGARVLEIGCGVGIIAKHLQGIASYVLGVDISERNVEIARVYAASPKCDFIVLDVIEQAAELDKRGEFDVVLLPDVIEHIPKIRYRELFATIERRLTSDGRVLLTYPSPEYQEFLRKNKPDVLQVVDETVFLTDILDITSLTPLFFGYRDIWQRYQYSHLVLSAGLSFDDSGLDSSWAQDLRYRIRKYRWRASNRSFLKKLGRKRRAG